MKMEDMGKSINNFLHKKGVTKHYLPTTDDNRDAESDMTYFEGQATSSRGEYARKKELAGFNGEIQEIQLRNILGQGYEAIYKAEVDGHQVQGNFCATAERGVWSLSGDSEVTVDGVALSTEAANIFNNKYAGVIIEWGFLDQRTAKANEVRVKNVVEEVESEQRRAEHAEWYEKKMQDTQILEEERRRLEASARNELDRVFAQPKKTE
ncbi:MAG: hypothetical protein A3D65_04625 [Candidatus Lloydbacteria bacterium RIFCSPHIGHO2_02_FULL_50_13]|uniref:Uncharacterized protein n=1 Tax=Candidatus Lloydbacteria bacterium RIFCSPHIGHO2_02_FULL_50_13 TaxID=1798661 RepID=A0A1G2D5M7_9BACT|nr:MAG: hypothetical protein A3D65_04625 [Candidatus Lloydbacteria bacterium RIFCSPHIGHO2_02_FULL_50_13]